MSVDILNPNFKMILMDHGTYEKELEQREENSQSRIIRSLVHAVVTKDLSEVEALLLENGISKEILDNFISKLGGIL